MICLENTPKNTGVYISGDINDFTLLLASLQLIIGENGDYVGYEQVRIRFLEFCSGIAESLHDERKVVFVDNGLKEVHGQGMTLTAVQDKNVYHKIPVLWSELLFIGYVANDFIEMNAKNNKHYWDIVPATIRLFQGVIAEHLEKTIGEHKFRLLKSSLTPKFIGYYQNYMVQYIDQLALDYLKNEIEDRDDAVSILARRIAIKDSNYIKTKKGIEKLAKQYKISVDDVEVAVVDTQKLDW
ncbi:hypothetical protein H9649_08105 [Sporosarcina sp. Sa2YVA2]|uniref:Uncharacterized protein n=1 Tax=Sporosarcina quadrami TaxID=2762234 RepID=A0ABR8UAF6_9BACL|nr:hypothetical protein [Sporosarcina quadrami]MBD7984539.1 hypothetical protein [Sporosarcina quadrami]